VVPPQCQRGFFCASTDGGATPQCFQPCDPYAENCQIGQACYYEPSLDALVCEPELDAGGYEGFACDENDECPVDPMFGGMACFPLNTDELDAGYTRACRYYCDNFDGGPHLCPGFGYPFRQCVPIAIVDAGGTPIAVGACQPYSP
jgi:hypothetical protein